MKLQNILDLSTFEITRFRVWNQTSQPSDKGLGSKYFNTNSGHEAYGREQIYTPSGWRTAAYMDDIEAINEKLDLIFGDEIDTDTIIDSWKEVQDFLSGIEDTTTLMTMLNGKLDKTGGTIKDREGLPLVLNTSSSTSVRLKLQMQGSDRVILGYNTTDGVFISAPSLGYRLGITTGGTPIFYNGTNRTLIHSGNIGEYKAGGLVKSVYIWGQSFDGTTDVTGSQYLPNQAVTFFYDTAGAAINVLHFSNANILHLGYGNRTKGYSTVVSGNNVYLYYGSGSQGFILNSSGNVGIGIPDPKCKLDVAGIICSDSRIYTPYLFLGKDAEGIYISSVGISWHNSSNSYTKGLIGFSSDGSSEFEGAVAFRAIATFNGGALIPTGKNMMFGDASGNAIVEYDADANAIKVTGNFYATGTVASGGKAQEGTGTGGSATVYPFTLTYGQAAYQIANPKSNTNVIVQVYEWNATTSSWDLILTDVNVTASKITVTFGRTTTVNHMVTVV